MKKKLLSIQYPAFLLPNVGLSIFEPLGYEVLRCDIVKYEDIEIVERLVLRDYKIKLSDCDVIAIVVAAQMEFGESGILFEKKVGFLQHLLDNIYINENKRILLMGIDINIPEPHCSRFAQLFDGLFIGAETSQKTQKEIFDKLRAFALLA